MPLSPHYRADLPILDLDDGFWDEVVPARFPKHVLRFRNDAAASTVGLATLTPAEWESAFARFEMLPENLSCPLALRYHGHQFGVYNPDLGDGRGFLFAQLRAGDGRLLDLATKGSGTTPWSRGGDGRLTLKGGVREVLAAEMLEALGVPTSRAFSLFETGEKLHRGDEPSPTRSSVLVRLGHSHVRFGTFQRLARLRDAVRMTRLVDHVVAAYYPDVEPTTGEERVLALLDRVVARCADLCASWMTAGFVHGVLNTDNMTITGESFDYGPWRFVPTFDPDFVAAYFDHTGIYAFGRQPSVVAWNLGRLADALRLVTPSAPLGDVLARYEERYREALARRTLVRLGLAPGDPDVDRALGEAAFAFLDSSGAPFEDFFFSVRSGRLDALRDEHGGPRLDAVAELLALYGPPRPMRAEAPCTMLIDEVEAIWGPIAEHDDWSLFDAKIAQVRAYGADSRTTDLFSDE